jgi:glycosyltransferase involved in cell wall biosynthesis
MKKSASDRVRVLHIIHRLGDGGADHALVRLVNASDSLRFEHTVLTLGAGPGYEPLRRGVRLLEASGRGVVGHALRASDRSRFDVVHGWVAHASIVAATLAGALGVSLVLRQPTNMEMELRYEPAQTRTYWPDLKRAYQAADVVIVPSAALVDSTRRVCGVAAPQVIPNAIDVPAATRRPTPSPGRPFVLATVGRLSPQKDPLTVIDAMAHLGSAVNWRLRIYGVGNLRSACIAQATRLGVLDRVELRGFDRGWTHPDAGIDAFVSATRYEGMSNAILEAAAAGLPIVTTVIPENREILRHGIEALLVPPGDAPAMAASIRRLVAEPRVRTALGSRARQRARQFSLTRMVSAHEAIYTTVARACRNARAA